jgi:hypothetical protein
MQASHPVSHSKYTGSMSVDGYPTGDAFDAPVQRLAYAVYSRPGRTSSQMSTSADYERRIVTEKIVLVPDTSVYSARDKVILSGAGTEEERTFFVSGDVLDYSQGPFGFKPSGDAGAFGEVTIEKVTG